MTTFTPEAIHTLLQALLAPAWDERRAADRVLSILSSASDDAQRPSPRMAALLDAAIERFGAQRDAFLGAVFAFYCNTSRAIQYATMSGLATADDAVRRGRLIDGDAACPLQDMPRPAAAVSYGLGTAWLLRSQAHRCASLVPQMIVVLDDRDSIAADTVWEMLGTLRGASRPAFPAMLALAFERGTQRRHGDRIEALAAIADADPACIALLIDALTAPAVDRRIAVICAITHRLDTVPPALFDALLAACRHAASADDRYRLLCALAHAAQRSGRRCADTLLDIAMRSAQSVEPRDRAAAAWTLARLGEPAAHADMLAALLADDDAIVRSNAADAAAAWTPPPAIAAAVARMLGDHAGGDGRPHAAAVSTLAAWGAHAVAALPLIDAWIRDDPASVAPHELARILDGLGAAAGPLRASVAAWHDAMCGDEHDHAEWDLEEDEAGPAVDGDAAYADATARDATGTPCEERQRRDAVSILLERMHLDPHEQVPGNRTQRDDPHARVRQWLDAIDPHGGASR